MYHKPRGRRVFVTLQIFNCVQELSDRARDRHKRHPLSLLNDRNPLHGKKEESVHGEGQSFIPIVPFLTFYLICYHPTPSFSPSNSIFSETFSLFFRPAVSTSFSWIIIVQPSCQLVKRVRGKLLREWYHPKAREREGFSERLAQSGRDLSSRFQFWQMGLNRLPFPVVLTF